jgi:hypothetical protein
MCNPSQHDSYKSQYLTVIDPKDSEVDEIPEKYLKRMIIKK